MRRIDATGKTRRVLLVDDNKNGTPARKAALQEHGYVVDTASSGAEALEKFPLTPFDLVVTDFRMPKMNGSELIAALRAQREDIPVILLSGFAETGGLNEANTGANIVLQKGPSEGAQLVRAVNRLLLHPRNTSATTRKPAAKAPATPAVKRASH